MSLVEFIGFIITFSAMIFLLARKASEERKRRQDPEKYEREQQRRARAQEELYHGLMQEKPRRPRPKIEDEEDEEPELVIYTPPTLPKQPSKQTIQKTVTQKVLPKKHHHRLDKKSLIINYTIFGPPKTLQDDPRKLFRP